MKNPLKAWFGDKEDEVYVKDRWKKLSSKQQQYLNEQWELRQEQLNHNLSAKDIQGRHDEIVAKYGLTDEEQQTISDVWLRGRPELSDKHPHYKERK